MFDHHVIYDTENTDLNTNFGQITQFGGIRFSRDLSELDSLSIDVRLLPWIIPTPKACSVTNITPTQLEDSERTSEFKAAQEIFKFLLPESGKRTAYVTFNGSYHDNDYLRTTFFRNMLNPWFASNDQVTHIDLFPLLQLINAVDPFAIRIPILEDGKQSYKLENVCPANGIPILAHDALGDAKATAQLLKLVYEKAPWAIDVAVNAGVAKNIISRVTTVMNEGGYLWLFTHFGEPDFIPVVPVSTGQSGRFWLYDLRNSDYANAIPADENLLFKGGPFHLVSAKKLPLFVDGAIIANTTTNFVHEEFLQLAVEIQSDEKFKNTVSTKAAAKKFMEPVNPQSEEKLIPFPSYETKDIMKKFTSTNDWAERSRLRFKDERIRDFAARILYDAHLNKETILAPNLLSQIEKICEPIMNRALAGIEARWTSLASAMMEEPDQGWLDWASLKYGIEAVESARKGQCSMNNDVEQQPKEPEAPQLSFGF